METMMGWLPMGFMCGAIGAAIFWLGPRAFTFLRAVLSGWNEENIKDRLVICKECPRVKQRDYVDPEGGLTSFLYCDECKCGSHHIAELNTKLGFNNLTCPMDKWGPAGGMTVHEGHDLLVARGAKERADDQRERVNIMAGRDRNDNGPLDNVPSGPARPGNRTAQAKAQLRPTDEASQAQRTRIQKAREVRNAAKHAGQTNKIWGESRDAAAAPAGEKATAGIADEEINNAAPLAGTDHEGRILVDQKKE